MSRLTPEREAEIRAEVALRIAAQPNERPNEEYLLAEIDALRQERDDKWGPSDRAYLERDQAREYAEELAARVRELETLIRRVMPEEMGGYPDLFYPTGGWEQFQSDAVAALGPTRRDA